MTQPTIARLRDALEQQQEIAPTNQRIGSDGKSYSVRQDPKRRTGTLLPEPSEPVLDRLFRSDEQRAQRKLAHYFQRLSLALDDGFNFENWCSADDAAAACRAVFNEDEIEELVAILGPAAANVFDAATSLGYRPDGEVN